MDGVPIQVDVVACREPAPAVSARTHACPLSTLATAERDDMATRGVCLQRPPLELGKVQVAHVEREPVAEPMDEGRVHRRQPLAQLVNRVHDLCRPTQKKRRGQVCVNPIPAQRVCGAQPTYRGLKQVRQAFAQVDQHGLVVDRAERRGGERQDVAGDDLWGIVRLTPSP